MLLRSCARSIHPAMSASTIIFYTTEKSKKKTNHYLEHEQDSCGEAAEPISSPAPSPAAWQRRGPADGSCSPPAPATGEHKEWGRPPGPAPLPDEPAPGRTRQMRCVRTAPHASSAPQHPSGHAAQHTKICSSKEKSFAKPVSNVKSYFPNWLLHLQSSSLAAAVGSQGRGEDGSPPLRLLSSPVPNHSGGRQSL